MLTKDNTYRVMGLFFRHPDREFYIREIARLTKLSAPGVLKITARLRDSGLILVENGATTKNVRASKTEKFYAMKRVYNIFSLYDSGLVDFLKSRYEEPEAVILFGSYSRGEDISKSDIDIAVITPKNLELDLKSFEKKLERKIVLYELRINECEKELLNNLANGITLHGYFKVIK